MKCADCENEVDIEASDVCSAFAARDHEIVALKRIIENGRAAHNEDRIARDWLARDRDAWKARAEKAEQERDELRGRWAHPDALHPNGRCTCAGEGSCSWCRDSGWEIRAHELIARATKAEAQVAAMLKAAAEWRDRPCRGGLDPCVCCEEANDHMPDDEYVVGGRTLLAELEALRELEQRVRKRCDEAVPQWGTELREALAAVDAARKGE